MGGAPSWNEDPDFWDSIEINNILFEELPVEVDVEIANEWDEKKAAGNDGAPATNKGYSVCHPKVSMTFWQDVHFELWQDLLKEIQPQPGKKAPPIVEVFHPQLAVFGKSKFNVAKIHGLKKVGPQMMQATIEFIEYFPAPKPAPKPAPVPAPPERERAFLELETFKPSADPRPEMDPSFNPVS